MNDEAINLISEIFATVIIECSGLVQDQQCPDKGELDGLFADVDLGIDIGILPE